MSRLTVHYGDQDGGIAKSAALYGCSLMPTEVTTAL
jgi:hypothetical protein